MIEEIVDEF